MKPEIIVMLGYFAFGIWMYSFGMKGRRGEFKSKNAHVISVFPGKRANMEAYKASYVTFHNRLMLASVAMGLVCAFVGRLLPIIFLSLFFFAVLNIYKVMTEQALRAVCEGGKGS